jgi:hypothetical protein
MRNQHTVELTAVCGKCGTTNTVVEVGLAPGTKVSCSHCAEDLGSLEELRQSSEEKPRLLAGGSS